MIKISNQKILEKRLAKKLTQKTLAYEAGVTEAYISKIERGVSDNLKIKTINKIALALDASPLYFLEEVS